MANNHTATPPTQPRSQMEARTTPSSQGRPPLRRGQIRNRIVREFFMSLIALTRPSRANGSGGGGGGGGSGTPTPTSSSAYTSEGSSDS